MIVEKIQQQGKTYNESDTVNLDKLMLVSIGKLFSEYSTFIIGELKQKQKYEFNLAVKAVDNFVKEVEKDSCKENLENLELISDTLTNGVVEMRNEILEKLK